MTTEIKAIESKLTRTEYLKEIFISDYQKAIKKNKMLLFSGDDFKKFSTKLDSTQLNDANKLIKSAKTRYVDNGDEMSEYIDPAFFAFKLQMGLSMDDVKLKFYNLIFTHFYDNDPTPHKEYLSWLLNLYRDIVRKRKPFCIGKNKNLEPRLMQDGSFNTMVVGGDEYRFFEDLYKIKDYLVRFEFLKKTNIIKEEKKDINKYNTYDDLLKHIKPFMTADEGSDDVDTLDHKEMLAIQNQIEFEANPKSNKHIKSGQDVARAKLMYEDDNFIIVYTVNKEANDIFGKYTTWCTAGNRYQNMFDTYDKQGYLFVLIEKGHGSKKAITKKPSARLQFNFESKQYMDADDRGIDIEFFLNKNEKIKNYFKDYIIKKVLPKLQGYKEHIEFLKKLGYRDELIEIYKKAQPEEIDLSGYAMNTNHLKEIGDIVSLKKLIVQDCNIKTLPDSWKRLTKLTHLDLSKNNSLCALPVWFHELQNLEVLKLNSCDLQSSFFVGGMSQLTNISVNFNTNLIKLPSGLSTLKKLLTLSLCNCNILEVDDEILGCQSLRLLDLHHNKKLNRLPLTLGRLPQLQGVAIDETNISNDDMKKINEAGLGLCKLIKYSR